MEVVNTKTLDVLTEVKDAIKKSDSDVANKVKAHFVEKEVASRVDLIVDALDKLRTMDKDLNKIKADQVAYDEDGKEVSATWTKPKLKERNDQKAKIRKLSDAVEEALANGDFEKLKNAKG